LDQFIMQPHKIILDTDIGDDVDDALALSLICVSPEVDLQAVTTVFGNVAARARQARTLLKIAGERFAKIPVAAGCGASMASRPLQNIKADFKSIPNQDSTYFPESELPPLDPRHAVNLLLDMLHAGDGNIIPITIGAMTNLAAALVMDHRIAAKIPKIIAMAGEFETHMAEWNIRCDPEAAHILFTSGIPIDIIPWQIGTTVAMTQSDLDQLAASNCPLAQRLMLAISAWQNDPSSAKKSGLPHLYDPMTIATLIQPDLVKWKRGTVAVELADHHTYAYTTFKEDPAGIHRVAFNANREASMQFFLARILE
jgi:purine nucleosidase/pyrimidine-specific ribonucleoside hydrolase